MHLMKGYHAKTISEALRKKKKSVLSKGEGQGVSANPVVERQLRLLPIPGHNDTALCDKTTEAHVRNKVILCHIIVSSSTVSCVTHEMET